MLSNTAERKILYERSFKLPIFKPIDCMFTKFIIKILRFSIIRFIFLFFLLVNIENSYAKNQCGDLNSFVSLNHMFSSDSQIESFVCKKYYEDFNRRFDLLIYFIEYYGYTCVEAVRVDYDIWCDLFQPVRVREGDEIFWGFIRRGILLSESGENLKISVNSFLRQ